VDLHGDAPLFRNRSGLPYSKDTLGDDFREIRQIVFPGDKRQLADAAVGRGPGFDIA
jgi:hypothetical protein